MATSNLPTVPGDRVARATFTALLTASSSGCDCETCKILRQVVEEMKKEFVPTQTKA